MSQEITGDKGKRGASGSRAADATRSPWLKVAPVFLAGLLLVIAADYALRNLLILPASESFEVRFSEQEIQRGAGSIRDEIKDCQVLAADWAMDERITDFFGGGAAAGAHLRARLAPDSIKAWGINAVALYDSSGRQAFFEGIGPDNSPLPDFGQEPVRNRIAEAVASALHKGEPSAGVERIYGSPAIIVIHPVSNGESGGAIRGALLLVWLLERNQILAGIGRGLFPYVIADAGGKADMGHSAEYVKVLAPSRGVKLGFADDHIVGRALLPGLGPVPSQVLLAVLSRNISEQGRAAANLISAILYSAYFLAAGLIARRFQVAFRETRGREMEIRKIVEEKTRELRRERDLFEAGPVFTIAWKAEEGWPVSFVSKNIEEILGFTPEEMTAPGMTFASLIHPEDLERVAGEVALFTSERRSAFSQSYRLRLKNGQHRWFYDFTRVEYSAAGEILSLRGYMFDQTEIIETQSKLKKNANFVAALLDAIPTPVFYKDRQGRYLGCNRAFTEFMGASSEQVKGRTVHELWPGSLAEVYHQKDLELMAFSGHQVYEFKVTDRTGVERPVIFAKDVFRDEHGEVAGLVGAFIDISDRKRAEEERQRAEQRLRHSQRMEAVGQLAGGVAHDFNNLLQVINGFCELALAKAGENSKIAADLRQIARAGNRASTLVRQLLDFGRRQNLDMRPLDLNRLIAEHIEMLKRLIGEHINLDFSPDRTIPGIHADPAQIEQILTNLLINARDAMPMGGLITIETAIADLDESFCATRPWASPGRYVRLGVADTGQGIEPQILAHIFDPFFTTKEIGKGTGLGLATVFGIVKQHGGLIDVQSEPGRGTAFEIYIPESERPAASEEHPPDSAHSTGSGTILVAEDEPLVLDLTRSILESAGYRVLAVGDGQAAVEMFEAHTDEIDLALLDILMPKLGGKAVFEKISSIRPGIKVLFASGYGAESISEGYRVGQGIEILRKPYRKADLLTKISELLENGNSRRNASRENS